FDDGPQASLSVTHAAREPQYTLHIFGSAGSIHVPVLNEGTITITTGEGERVEILPPHANTHQPLIEDFVQAVRQGRDPRVGGLVGREVARVEEEIYDDAGDKAGAD
ncbi:MAG: hypothetical protein ACJ741_01275, partial [Pyrinomonadaceae bacterium]